MDYFPAPDRVVVIELREDAYVSLAQCSRQSAPPCGSSEWISLI
jgi:hypothetical protein